MTKSIGVTIANMVSKDHDINDTIWVNDLTTLADIIDCELKEGRKQGALEELKKVEKEMNKYFSGAFAKQYIQKRIKELEEGVSK